MTDKFKNDIKKKLSGIGLSPKEAVVYLDLLARGMMTGTSKIVKATGLHGQFVYDALATLEAKGLVTHVIVGRRKRFAAVHPSRLMYLADQQKRLVNEVVQDLSSIGRENVFQDFEIYQGNETYIAGEFDELDRAEEAEVWDIFAGEIDHFYDIFTKEILAEYDEARAQKRILIRCLISHADKPGYGKSNPRPYFELRVLPNFGKSLINTVVRPHSYSLTTFVGNVLTFKVINDEVAKSYHNFFESLWDISEKV